jgi:hypothetical protein
MGLPADLRARVCARALRASQNVKRVEVRACVAGKSTELQRPFKPRASFVSGVALHATRVFFGFN